MKETLKKGAIKPLKGENIKWWPENQDDKQTYSKVNYEYMHLEKYNQSQETAPHITMSFLCDPTANH